MWPGSSNVPLHYWCTQGALFYSMTRTLKGTSLVNHTTASALGGFPSLLASTATQSTGLLTSYNKCHKYLSLSLIRLPRVSHQPRSLGEPYTVRALMQCFLAWRAERVNPISNHRITRLTKKIPRLLILRHPTVSKEPSAASDRLSPQSIPSNKDVLSLSRYRAVSNLAPGKPVSRRRWWQTPWPPTPRRRGGLWDEDEDDERDDHVGSG
ncbi:hypothetical protein IWZ03DRAFT_175373 [Phyllosticta citriasiana]|uniref:Uncharacterized protein n=1 Tax=Phyllosticta citriasiana TaxID=595635 RepID=A0ABR1KM61_9PEZI